MRPTFMGLETAKRGIQVNQKAIDIVGNNISNAKTKGYTRQRLDSVSVHTYGSDQYNYSSIPLAGQGVDVKGAAQIRIWMPSSGSSTATWGIMTRRQPLWTRLRELSVTLR